MTTTPLDLSPLSDSLRVSEAMHLGLISCSFESPLRTAARLMATHRVHAILVTAHGDSRLPEGGPWAIVTDTDLLLAAETADLDDATVRTIATTSVHVIASTERLASAAQLMAEQSVSHVVVLEPRSRRGRSVCSRRSTSRAPWPGFRSATPPAASQLTQSSTACASALPGAASQASTTLPIWLRSP